MKHGGAATSGAPACSEETPLRHGGAPREASKAHVGVLLGLCVAYAFCILPVGLGSGLMPALEEDPELGWSPLTSGLYMGASMWAVAFGAFAIGWIPDHLPNALVLLMYLFGAAVLLDAMSFAHTAASFIMLHVMVYVMKSVTWPAAMSILGTHLAIFRPELGILLVGLFSRLSSVGSSVFIGNLLMYMSWRSGLQVCAAILVCAVVSLRFVIRLTNMEHLLERTVAQHAAAPEPTEASVGVAQSATAETQPPARGHAARVGAYCAQLFTDKTFLLLICFAIGLELSLGLPLFVSAFMHSIFRASIADSAIWSGTMNIGEVASLLLGLLLVLMGVRRSVLWNLVMTQLGIGVVVTMTIIFVDVSFHQFFALGTVLGFATTLGGYLVVPIHCIELAKAKSLGDIATRVTIADGLATLVGATTRILIGMARNTDEGRGLLLSAIFAFCGTSAMLWSLFALSRDPPESLAAGSHAD